MHLSKGKYGVTPGENFVRRYVGLVEWDWDCYEKRHASLQADYVALRIEADPRVTEVY